MISFIVSGISARIRGEDGMDETAEEFRVVVKDYECEFYLLLTLLILIKKNLFHCCQSIKLEERAKRRDMKRGKRGLNTVVRVLRVSGLEN